MWQVVIFVAVCQAAGLIGVVTTPTADSDWFRALAKPFFNPPSWLFAPVWTTLYTLMGIAAFRVWRKGSGRPVVRIALALFVIQLVLNAAWTPVFFGAQSLLGGFVVLLTLVFVLLLTTGRFFRLDRASGWLLVPYLLWTLFALGLNLSFLLLNA